MTDAPRLCLFGAPGDTGNLGVSALLHSTLDGVAARLPDSDLVVFDHSAKLRQYEIEVEGRPFRYRAHGARWSRRYWRADTFRTLAVAARMGGLGSPGARALARADAVLAVGGGDSFSDMYGSARFDAIAGPMLTALRLGHPLLLLPQTYGPFANSDARAAATKVLRNATVAWARDVDSLAALKDLVGEDFDHTRHRLGVDLAFGLRPQPAPLHDGPLGAWLSQPRDHPVVGVNVSGLLYNQQAATRDYGLTIDYAAVIERLVRRLLEDGDNRVILIPHVRGYGGVESDELAAVDVARRIGSVQGDRLAIAPFHLDVRETKWLIGQLDWFCGTRMHSTIAALSQCIPAAAIAYSMKTRGVFASCGQQNCVADARHFNDDTVLETVWQTFVQRSALRRSLGARIPDVIATAQTQFDDLAAILMDLSITRSLTLNQSNERRHAWKVRGHPEEF